MATDLDVRRNRDFYWSAENYELHTFSAYLTELDKFLSEEIKAQRAKIEELQAVPWSAEENGGEEPWWLNDYEYLLQQYESFANLMLKSFIVSLYTFLESSLMERCRRVERAHNYRLSVKDLSGQGIQQAINYLSKVHQVEYSLEKSTEWMQLQNIRRLRNCIVHNGGRLDRGTEQIRQLQDYIDSDSEIGIDKTTGEITLSRAYCEKVLLIVTRFLYAIDKVS